MSGTVSPLVLAHWEDVQAELRNLALQRGLRFIAVAVLVPFGITAVGKEAPGPDLSSVVFGITLLFLAIGELAALGQSGLYVRQRKELEKAHPALVVPGKPAKLARGLEFVSGPGFSSALYALLGPAFLLGGALPG